MRALRHVLLSAFLLSATALPALAQPSAEAGQRVFNQCRACHVIQEGARSGVGPNLHGVWGRPAGQVEGFRYSAAMRQKAAEGLVWTEENLRAYLANPRDVVPGGSMAFAGVRNPEQLESLLLWLRQAAGGPGAQ
jgi:cytochrome c